MSEAFADRWKAASSLSRRFAGELQKNYVEARLHTDGEDRLTPEVNARNKELQKAMAKSSANPYFVIYDPVTGQVLRKKGGMLFEKEFLKLLRGGGIDLNRDRAFGFESSR